MVSVPLMRPPMPCVIRPNLLAADNCHASFVAGLLMNCLYSMAAPVTGCATEFAQHWCRNMCLVDMLAVAAVAERVRADIGCSCVAVGSAATLDTGATLGVLATLGAAGSILIS
jgi:hypothetical protein